MTEPAGPGLQLVTFKDSAVALGVAVRLTARYAAFAGLSFGEWAEVLVGQADRGHQLFVINAAREVRGFFGYAIAPADLAEAWANGSRRLASDECRSGNCLILNAWVSTDRETRRVMVQALRRLGQNKRALYFKRFYADGTVRSSRIPNTDIMMRHLAKDDGRLRQIMPAQD
jgi:hypothetical protein